MRSEPNERVTPSRGDHDIPPKQQGKEINTLRGLGQAKASRILWHESGPGKKKHMVRVLFVCMGNICRSPTAHGVFAKLVREHGLEEQIHIESAGTHAYHVGDPPDVRAQDAAARRDVDLSRLRARQVTHKDFAQFDYILAMDRDNLDILTAVAPQHTHQKMSLFLEFAPNLREAEVPDPYYGGTRGFDRVLDLVEAAADGLLSHLRLNHPQL